ncbi:hypothetical protein [Thalassococcus sp. S3]|uniref:hypothetical protein n=1 Tax=Thalassococcus sp. S3 TaxID=2017482 RepID=UPI0010248F00|nr:hypothetical protein [Thalassococcus sp. S3]QBF29772.1 hypothetical protein CFI11_00885 [Thalassococcus sp. S3]
MSSSFGSLQDAARGYKITRRPANGPYGLESWLVIPDHLDPEAVPHIAVHGIQRRASQQAELLAERATQMGRIVIAPLFDKQRWPKYQRVVIGKRADLALLRLISALKQDGLWSSKRFEISGFSGGAQFAHRFAMLYPNLISRLITCSAGWYTFPDDATYPYGLSPSRSLPGGLSDHLEAFLSLPIDVCVGDEDCVPTSFTRSGPEIDAQQGRHRLARAARWAGALRQIGRARGLETLIDFHALPDCGHQFATCVTRGGLDRILLADAPSALAQGPALPRPGYVVSA